MKITIELPKNTADKLSEFISKIPSNKTSKNKVVSGIIYEYLMKRTYDPSKFANWIPFGIWAKKNNIKDVEKVKKKLLYKGLKILGQRRVLINKNLYHTSIFINEEYSDEVIDILRLKIRG